MESILVTLPDGTEKAIVKGATARDVAEVISPKLARSALAAKFNDETIDLAEPIVSGGER